MDLLVIQMRDAMFWQLEQDPDFRKAPKGDPVHHYRYCGHRRAPPKKHAQCCGFYGPLFPPYSFSIDIKTKVVVISLVSKLKLQ